MCSLLTAPSATCIKRACESFGRTALKTPDKAVGSDPARFVHDDLVRDYRPAPDYRLSGRRRAVSEQPVGPGFDLATAQEPVHSLLPREP